MQSRYYSELLLGKKISQAKRIVENFRYSETNNFFSVFFKEDIFNEKVQYLFGEKSFLIPNVPKRFHFRIKTVADKLIRKFSERSRKYDGDECLH